MKTSTIIQLTARYQLAQTLFVLVATMVSPILIHLLPDINGYTPGAVLLPIFFAPLIAVFIYKPHVAIFSGIFAPVLNYLILGLPTPPVVITMGVEVVLFVWMVYRLKDFKPIGYLAAPISYMISSLLVLLGLSVFSNVVNPFTLWTSNMLVALPGILLLGLVNFTVLKLQE